MKKTLLFLLVCFTFTFVSCGRHAKKSQAQISVVTTNFPLYDAARAVSGGLLQNQIEIKLLVKPGTEVHSYDPSPADIISIQNADLFAYVGGESDRWIEKILEGSKNEMKAKRIALINYVWTLDEAVFDGDERIARGDEHFSHGDEHFSRGHERVSHGDEQIARGSKNVHEADEHIWTSPENFMIIVQTVSDSLIKIAGEKNIQDLAGFTEEVQKNTSQYISKIQETADHTNRVLSEKSEKFILMADRFPFAYYADYFNLDFDAAFSGCSTAVEDSTATVSRLIDTVRRKNLPAVFYIELGNHKIADTIAQSTGTKALMIQSVQNVTKDDFENGETWVSLMTKNAQVLESGLR